jgi:hypothetical protein
VIYAFDDCELDLRRFELRRHGRMWKEGGYQGRMIGASAAWRARSSASQSPLQ